MFGPRRGETWNPQARLVCFARGIRTLKDDDGLTMIARFLLALIRAYQVTISPWLGKVCRFEPSCSRYAAACLEAHGAARGSLLSIKRLCKCHPFHPGGFDPPPRPRRRATLLTSAESERS